MESINQFDQLFDSLFAGASCSSGRKCCQEAQRMATTEGRMTGGSCARPENVVRSAAWRNAEPYFQAWPN